MAAHKACAANSFTCDRRVEWPFERDLFRVLLRPSRTQPIVDRPTRLAARENPSGPVARPYAAGTPIGKSNPARTAPPCADKTRASQNAETSPTKDGASTIQPLAFLLATAAHRFRGVATPVAMDEGFKFQTFCPQSVTPPLVRPEVCIGRSAGEQ